MTIRRTLIAALAAAALISPAAQAEGPPDMHASTTLAAAETRAAGGGAPDMHASTAEAAARARENRVDLQSRQPPAGRPAATDDGSPAPVVPIVAGVLGMLIAGLAAHYGVRRFNHRSRIAA